MELTVDLPPRLAEKLALLARLTHQPPELLVSQAVEYWLRGEKGPFELLDSLCKQLLQQLVSTSLDRGDPVIIASLSREFLEAVDLRGQVTLALRQLDGRTLGQIQRRLEAMVAALEQPQLAALKLADVRALAKQARRDAERCERRLRELRDEKWQWEHRADLAVIDEDDNLAKEALMRAAECESEQALLEHERPVLLAHAELLEYGLSLITDAQR